MIDYYMCKWEMVMWLGYVFVYNFEELVWFIEELVCMLVGEWVGILMYLVWFVVYSGNFEMDLVRWGKWIWEYLFGDIVLDILINV